jgi:hypothetical protein
MYYLDSCQADEQQVNTGEVDQCLTAHRKARVIASRCRTLANVWVRIIYAMWLKREGYTSETFLHAQLAHAAQVD